jgi:glycosidase
MDYISSLGTSMIYLSPVFLSPTYHKYDTIDYYTVESAYGGEDALKEMTDTAHARGMAVILDGVFNHSSNLHPFFQDVVKKGRQSPYYDWYCISRPPEEGDFAYDSFGGLVPEMPRWNTANPKVADYLIQAACYWTERLSLDGWRLDVADEIPHGFWKKFRSQLHKINPDIILIGEIWNHASGWLMGDELDTSTNYKFRNAMLALAKGAISCMEFWNKIAANLRLYKKPVWPYLVNMLGSHDTVRLHTEVKDGKKASLALLCSLCFEGIQLIYYGDEAAMTGGEDPDNRRAMQWGANPSFIAEVQKLGGLRRRSHVLRCGDTVPVMHRTLLCFERRDGIGTIRITAISGMKRKR